MATMPDFTRFDPRTSLQAGDRNFTVFSVKALETLGYGPIDRLPYSLRILLEKYDKCLEKMEEETHA